MAVTLTSSNAAVISVTRSGTLKGESLGSATITASYRGFTATRAMTVEPDYTGAWSTSYTLTSCADQGAFVTAGWCRQLAAGPLPVSIGLRRVGTEPNGSSLARQTNQLLPGGSWDPAGTPADVAAFPPVSNLSQLVDRFKK